MGSELIYRGHDSQPATDSYSPKPIKPWFAVTRPIRYMLREQRLVFVIVGIAIATLFFTVIPTSYPVSYGGTHSHVAISDSLSYYPVEEHQRTYNPRVGFGAVNSGGKIPLGLKRKGLRIVVTGGAGFVGSHLVDRLIARGDSVIVVDNFFTGRKENVMHHFGNPNFELIRHDVVEPLLLEVDQIYHLACPASPVHYKFNPVKTIISFFFFKKKNCFWKSIFSAHFFCFIFIYYLFFLIRKLGFLFLFFFSSLMRNFTRQMWWEH